MVKRWIPLEANPVVMTSFAAKLGLDTEIMEFCDIYGLDEDLLAMVPQPVFAVLLLFPVTTALDAEAARVDEHQRQSGASDRPDVFYMKQTISNACGTIGVLHAIGNIRQYAKIGQDSFFSKFFDATAGMSPSERGAYLESPPPGAPDIEEAHLEAALAGETPANLDEDVTPHYIALVNHKGRLIELDGRKSFPVDHGPTSQGSLLQDAAVVAKMFIDRSNSLNFNMMALTSPSQ